MQKRWIVAVCAAAALTVAGIGGAGIAQDAEPAKPEVKIVSSDENLMGLELWGTWVMKEDLTRHITHEVPKDLKDETITFTKGDEHAKAVTANLPGVLEEMIKKNKKEGTLFAEACKNILFAGGITLQRGDREPKSTHFFVVSMFGNTYLCILAPSADGKFGLEFANTQFVRDPKADNDLLFIGDDHRDEPFVAFERKKAG